MNRPSSLFAFIFVVFAFGCRGRNATRSDQLSVGPSITPSGDMRQFSLPIKEASGLCYYVDPQTGHRHVLVVNDSDKKLLVIDYEKMLQGDLSFVGFDLATMGRQQSQTSDAASQWEAVFADKAGRVFISNEEASTIEIFDVVKKTKIGLIELKIPSDDERLADLKTSWEQEPGSRVEGFVILPNGHILAVKEKNPPLLIEFAPHDEKASGVKMNGHQMNPSSDVRQSELNSGINWPGRPDNKFVYYAKKVWSPASDYPADLDISELVHTDRGELALLSDRLQTIFVLGSELSLSDRTFKIKEKLTLPTTIEKPEGLLFIPGSGVLIASDLKELTSNLFWINRIRK